MRNINIIDSKMPGKWEECGIVILVTNRRSLEIVNIQEINNVNRR